MTGSPRDSYPAAIRELDLASGFGPETDNPAIRRLLLDEIGASGRITFQRFMELVLYHPTQGYYTGSRAPSGREGDYVTSPTVSPLFGYAIAWQLAEFWRCLGSPREFCLLEFGAGTGVLAADILRWVEARDPAFFSALHYCAVERSDSLRRRMAESLSAILPSANIEILDTADSIPRGGLVGCVLANELVDSFPVHRVVMRQGRLRELYVALEGGRLVGVEAEPSIAALQQYFDRLGLSPGEGNIAEVNLAAPEWIAGLGSLLQRAYALMFDYGYPAERLYAPWRRGGTLLCFRGHEALEDPFRFLGRQDMTAHVDFSTLQGAAERAGIRILGQTDQRRLLTNLGIGASVGAPPAGGDSIVEYYARRRAVEALTDPAGLGRIGVMLFGKDVPACAFTGFAPQPEASDVGRL